MTDATFTLEQAMAAQKRLRETIGLPEETFPVAAFVEMIGDEIEGMRAAGRTDADTASAVADATGVRLDPADIARLHAEPDRRSRRD